MKKIVFFGILSHRKYRSRPDPYVPKCHGSGTLPLGNRYVPAERYDSYGTVGTPSYECLCMLRVKILGPITH
jgi:hypothetical protein